MKLYSDVVICGAGIAGVSAAYFLSEEHGISNIVLVDSGPPLSLTSDHSTECYRNWWPGRGMVELMNRSIAILDELADKSGNVFNLNRRGYLYLTADKDKIPEMVTTAQRISNLGAGPLRIYDDITAGTTYQPSEPENYTHRPEGADLFLAPDLIHKYFKGITPDVTAALHVRKAGWLSAQQLGIHLLNRARQNGIRFLQDHVTSVSVNNDQVNGINLASGDQIHTNIFVNAAGPHIQSVCKMMDLEVPVYNELHLKISMREPNQVVDRSAPLLIWNDTQKLPWTEEEQRYILEDDQGWLLGELPEGVHTRPEGQHPSQVILALWEYNKVKSQPEFPIPIDPFYPEIVLRGLCCMLPGMRKYLLKMPRPQIDGGYYTKTEENMPLIGKLPIEGAYIIGAFSGFGIMVSCGAGELLSKVITGAQLPSYARYFSLDRYQDPEYIHLVDGWDDTGQL